LEVETNGRYLEEVPRMALYCPFCSEPITPDTTKCPSCDNIYSPDALSFINLSAKGQDEYPEERRKQTRFTIKSKAVYTSPKNFMEHYIFDLSLGGLFVETNSPLDTGGEFDLRIFLLDKTEPMEIPCEVIWNRKKEELTPEGECLPAGMGVKFLKLSQENLHRLIDILDRSLS